MADVELIAGGPQTASFYSVILSPGVGLLSYNFLDVYGGEIFFFSSDNEFMVMSPSLNLANFGFPLGDQFANLPSSGVSDTTWNPATLNSGRFKSYGFSNLPPLGFDVDGDWVYLISKSVGNDTLQVLYAQ